MVGRAFRRVRQTLIAIRGESVIIAPPRKGVMVKERDIGFNQGVAWAICYLIRGHGEDTLAEMMFNESGITMREMSQSRVDEVDRKLLRKVSPTRRQY